MPRNEQHPPPPPDLPPPATSVRTEPRYVIPAAPPFHSLRFRLLPWCVRGDWAPTAGAARRGQGAPPPSPRAMMVIRELLDNEDPLSTGSPPFVPEPSAVPAPIAAVLPHRGLPAAGGRASPPPSLPVTGSGRAVRWPCPVAPSAGRAPCACKREVLPSRPCWPPPPRPGDEASYCGPQPPRLLYCGEEVTTARGQAEAARG
jgi:hypothetical protein